MFAVFEYLLYNDSIIHKQIAMVLEGTEHSCHCHSDSMVCGNEGLRQAQAFHYIGLHHVYTKFNCERKPSKHRRDWEASVSQLEPMQKLFPSSRSILGGFHMSLSL